jgi:hypothetical protein
MKPTTRKQIGMETGVPQSSEKPLPKPVVYRNDAQKYDQYPNPARNSLKISKGDTLDRLIKSKPMNEQQRLEVMGKAKKTSPADQTLRIKSGSQLSKALSKFK